MSLPELVAITGFSLEQIKASLETLERHDVVKTVKGRYVYTVELMRRWVKQRQASASGSVDREI